MSLKEHILLERAHKLFGDNALDVYQIDASGIVHDTAYAFVFRDTNPISPIWEGLQRISMEYGILCLIRGADE